MSKHNNILAGIDIGTQQIKVVVVRNILNKRKKNTDVEIIGYSITESRGIKNGYINDPEEVVKYLKKAIRLAEKSAGVKIKQANLSINSIGLEEYYSLGETVPVRADSEITKIDIEKTIQDSEDKVVNKITNKQILHKIPLRYTLDGSEILGRPLGLKGTKLEVHSLFIVSPEQHLENIIKITEELGIQVANIIASPLASESVLLTKLQKRSGCMLIDIGAETTSIVIFEDSAPISLKVFPFGSNDITNDIALSFQIPLEDADKIKRGMSVRFNYSKRKLEELLKNKHLEMFEVINNHLKTIGRDRLLPAGVILTGGGCRAYQLIDISKSKLSLPTEFGTNTRINNYVKNKTKAELLSTAFGLCLWDNANDYTVGVTGIIKNKSPLRLWSWISRFLP